MDFYKIKKKSKYNTSFIFNKKKSKYNTSSFTFNSMCSFSKGFIKSKFFLLSEIKKTDCN